VSLGRAGFLRRLGLGLLIVLVLAKATSARADEDDPRERARQAYDRGTAAHRRGDFAEAATDFARADELAPSPVALRAALDEAVHADDPALGMELIERSSRASAEGDLAASIAAARLKFHGRAGRVYVHCPEGSSCLATVDAQPVLVGKPVWVRAGQHTVVVQVGESPQSRLVEVRPDGTTDVTPVPTTPALVPTTPAAKAPGPTGPSAVPASEPPPSAPRPARAAASGLSPVWFWVGVGATAVLGGATAVSAVDTSSKHDTFANDGCARGGAAGCGSLSSDGMAAQTRTNVLLGVAGAVALVTVIVGAAFTRWSDDGKPAGAATGPCMPFGPSRARWTRGCASGSFEF
jgi:hypothetical protein